MTSNEMDHKQATAILKMQMAAQPDKKVDLTQPVLMVIPFDSDKRKATGILDASEFSNPKKIQEMVEFLDMADVKLAQVIYRFPDESESWVGDFKNEQMMLLTEEGSKADPAFIEKLQGWGKHALANPTNAVKFFEAPKAK